VIFYKWIYSIISFTNLTHAHCMCFAIFQTGDVRRWCTSWWRAENSDWKSEFHETIFSTTLTDLLILYSLGYYGITYIWTEIRHYFVILKFSNFPVWNRQYCFNEYKVSASIYICICVLWGLYNNTLPQITWAGTYKYCRIWYKQNLIYSTLNIYIY
jgi:hypothetical protein